MKNVEIYIIKQDEFGEDYNHVIDFPTVDEKRIIENDIKWGMTKGIISLRVPERTSTTYWRKLFI